jgi:CheY-like chemotaxis protein
VTDSLRILIAEDDPISQKILEKILQKWGYEPLVASTGLEAWEMIQSPYVPRLIILDWMMPEMDGIEVCRLIRSEIKENPPYVIFITARTTMPDMMEAFEAGADDFITKPFNANELQSRLKAGIRILTLQSELEQRITDLQKAMKQINTLHGLIPICSYCHSIRDDQESWHNLESYIQKHSEASFSHGICPVCMKKHHPDFYKHKYGDEEPEIDIEE